MAGKVHLYSRVSTLEQDTLSIQLSECKKLYPPETQWVEYAEKVSGWGKKQRPEYQILKRRIAQGQVEEVCFYQISRMGRSVQEAMAFLLLCQQHGVRVRVVSPNLDFGGPFGPVLFMLFASLAQMESDSKSLRTRATFQQQKLNGTFKPHGNVKGCVSQRTKQVASQVYKMLDDKQSYRYIADMLGVTEGTVQMLAKRRGERLMTRAEYAAEHPDWHTLPRERRVPASEQGRKPRTKKQTNSD